MGVALAQAGRCAFDNSLPDSISKARRKQSVVPAMKTRPPAVTIGPPRLMEPGGICGCSPPKSPMEPRGTCQRIFPSVISTAVSMPQGGGLHGKSDGDWMKRRKKKKGGEYRIVLLSLQMLFGCCMVC